MITRRVVRPKEFHFIYLEGWQTEWQASLKDGIAPSSTPRALISRVQTLLYQRQPLVPPPLGSNDESYRVSCDRFTDLSGVAAVLCIEEFEVEDDPEMMC
jgi:hypothetical protein